MRIIVGLAVVLLVVLAGFSFWNNKTSLFPQMSSSSQTPSDTSESTNNGSRSGFENPKKSAHYETNTPAHGAILASVPLNVVIDFNFDLAKPSEIKILKDGVDVGVGETTIDNNKLAMRRDVDPNAEDGLYRVEYNACWPDGSCHQGYFQFVIDRSLADEFTDQTGKNEVVIRMSDIKFVPQDLKISKGTTVTWINDDAMDHYVNTDSHPAHTYYPEQNSRAIKQGESYSLTFDEAGIYPYHCSAHATSMIGSIVVE